MNKLFSRFRRKLMIEAVCKALLMGALIGAGIELAFLIVMHLISRNPGWMMIGCVFGIPFLLAFAILFGVVYFPTQKRIARRLDRSGLAERAGTMLEFKDKSSTIIDMQRADAVERIQNTTTKQIPFRISTKAALACVIVIALSAGSMFVPYNIMDMLRAEASSISKAEAQLIRSLLEALRYETSQADIEKGLKDQLYDSFDELEADLAKSEGELERAAQISEAEVQVQGILGGEISKDQIGSALRQYGAAADLGKAMEKGSTENVSSALEKMKADFLSRSGAKQAERLERIASTIENALSSSGITQEDELYSVLHGFAESLNTSAKAVSSGQDVSKDIEDSVVKAEGAINSVLEEQNKPDALLDRLLELLGGAKKDILNADFPMWETQAAPGDLPEGETSATETGSAETEDPAETKEPGSDSTDRENSDSNSDTDSSSDSDPVEGDPNQNGQSSEGSLNTMTEVIYDPTLGNIEYGQVFAAYYADYLASVNNGQIPADMQELLEKYFESLNK